MPKRPFLFTLLILPLLTLSLQAETTRNWFASIWGSETLSEPGALATGVI
jgi:hypothetical protein